jgi:adhesin transport system outer membrane protein
LLDVLDAQNTRYNVQAQAETARMSKLYAQYRVLAASNRLVEALGVQMPVEALANQRAKFHVNPIPPEDRLENSFPYPVMGPPPPNAAPAPMAEPTVEPAPEPAPAGR